MDVIHAVGRAPAREYKEASDVPAVLAEVKKIVTLLMTGLSASRSTSTSSPTSTCAAWRFSRCGWAARDWATDRPEILSTFFGSLGRFVDALPPAPPELAALPSAVAFEAVHALATDPDPGRTDFPWDRSTLYGRLLLLPNNCAPFDATY